MVDELQIGNARRAAPPHWRNREMGSEDVCFAGCEEPLAAMLKLTVDRGTGDAEQFRDLCLGVLASIVHLEQQGPLMCSRARFDAGCGRSTARD